MQAAPVHPTGMRCLLYLEPYAQGVVLDETPAGLQKGAGVVIVRRLARCAILPCWGSMRAQPWNSLQVVELRLPVDGDVCRNGGGESRLATLLDDHGGRVGSTWWAKL